MRPPRPGSTLPRLYVRAIDALDRAGDGERAGVLAEEAYRRFAGHPDPGTAAVIRQRAAYFRAIDAPAAGLPLMEEALRLFEQAPPSADHAEAWLDYASSSCCTPRAGCRPAVAGAEPGAGDRRGGRRHGADPPHPGRCSRHDAFLRGQVEEGFALCDRARALAEAAGDGPALVWLAVQRKRRAAQDWRSSSSAAEVALRGLRGRPPGRPGGLRDGRRPGRQRG